jgi:hypothetical protein
VPHEHWQTTTFVGARRHDRMAAPMLLDGPLNGAAFQASVEPVLAATRRHRRSRQPARAQARRRPSGDRDQRRGRFPPPDFDPSKASRPAIRSLQETRPAGGGAMAFAELKPWLDKAADRTIDDLWSASGVAMQRFTPAECQNDFQAAGYDGE